MKPEQAELFLIEELFNQSQTNGECLGEKLINVDRLTGDASTRRYYRLFTDKSSYVACLDNPTKDANEKNLFIAKQEFLLDMKVRVPLILDKNPLKGYILEEDLGDTTLLLHLASIENPENELKIFKIILDDLIQMHSIPLNVLEKSQLFDLRFDEKKLMEEMDFTFKFFIKLFLKNEDESFVSNLRSEALKICGRIARESMVLTHRDFHSRNVMVKGDEFVIIDFQDARLGIPQYDLVSLLEDCYYDLQENNKEYLKKYYFENSFKKFLHQPDYKYFCQLYDDMTFQRVFKAIGSFSYIYNTRKDERYLKYIGFAMEKLRRMMLADSRYSKLRQLLFQVYYES